MMKRKKISRFLAIGLCGAVLAGCSTNEDNAADNSATESAETQSMDTTSSESSSATSEESSSSENQEEVTNSQEQEDSELTEEESKDTLVDYIKENDPEMGELIDAYDILIEKEGDKYRATVYPAVSTDESKGRSLVASYEIDKMTGEVEKIENENTQTKSHLSEIVDFSKEELRAHNEKLAGGSEYIQDKVYEHLMLPGIHENTKKYEGRINPGERIRFTFPDAEKFHERSIYDPEISEDGYFTINLNAYEFKAGQDILVSITGGYPEEQTFNLTVNEAQKGMEDIRVRE